MVSNLQKDQNYKAEGSGATLLDTDKRRRNVQSQNFDKIRYSHSLTYVKAPHCGPLRNSTSTYGEIRSVPTRHVIDLSAGLARQVGCADHHTQYPSAPA